MWDKCRKPLVEGQTVGSSKRRLNFYRGATDLFEMCFNNRAVIAIELECRGMRCAECRFLLNDDQGPRCSLFLTQKGEPRKLRCNANPNDVVRLDMCESHGLLEHLQEKS
jgi:hypothetical protein